MHRRHSEKLTYWIYAIINRFGGRKYKIERGYLHGTYAVNRHDLDIKASKEDLEALRRHLIATLEEVGFENGVRKDQWQVVGGDYDEYITIHEVQPCFPGSSQYRIPMSSRAYKRF